MSAVGHAATIVAIALLAASILLAAAFALRALPAELRRPLAATHTQLVAIGAAWALLGELAELTFALTAFLVAAIAGMAAIPQTAQIAELPARDADPEHVPAPSEPTRPATGALWARY